MRRFSTLAALCLCSFGATARADDDEPKIAFELAGDTVIVHVGDTEKPIKVGCTPRSFVSSDTTAWALCAPNVVVVVESSPDPHVAERRPLAVRVISLSMKDGVVQARSDAGVKPLAQYAVATPTAAPRRAGPVFEEWSPSPPPVRRVIKRPPQITGPEIGLLGTAGAGVDAVPGAFAYLDASLVQRFPFGLSLAAFGVFGAGTGDFQTGIRETGPFGGDTQVAVGEALIGYDARWFAFSVGSGAAMTERGYQVEPLFVLRGRGGELDSFTFTWHTSFVVHGPNAMGVWGIAIEFPVTRRLWLGADAEVGALRYGRFMMDIRHRLSPQGQRSTFDLRASIGLAYVHSSASCQTPLPPPPSGFTTDIECIGSNADYLGPGVSFGFLWRP